MRNRGAMPGSTISKADFNRAVLAMCPNPPRWFRKRAEEQMIAALAALNITVRTTSNKPAQTAGQK